MTTEPNFTFESCEPLSDRFQFRQWASETIAKYRSQKAGAWERIEIHSQENPPPPLGVDAILRASEGHGLGKK